MKTVNLDDLVGLHQFSGCDFGTTKVRKEWNDYDEDASFISFVLDGKNYTALEDPSDGYRSMMKRIYVSRKRVQNTFAPQQVMGFKKPNDWHQNDTLLLIDTTTGKVVLEVGTNSNDDYYPSFAACFSPENLALNKD